MRANSVLIVLFFIVNGSKGQSPVNGGFEDGLSQWTSTGSTGPTNARTGIRSLVSASSTSATNTAHINSTVISVANGSFAHVIGWATGSNSFSNASCGGTLNASTNSTATANIGTTLTRLIYNVQNNTGSVAVFNCRVNSRTSTAGNATQVYWDDVIMYTDAVATPDLVKPLPASGFMNGLLLPNTVNFSWTNGLDAATGIQATIILRTTNTSASVPVMNDQGVYSVSGGNGEPNMVDADWVLLNNSLAPGSTSYIDNSVSPSTSYKYAVVHRDLAYNYSNSLVSGIITTPVASPVPVGLFQFSVFKAGEHNQLHWSTTSESNNLGFEIHRSTDGSIFNVIGFKNSIAPGGNSNDLLEYVFTDTHPPGKKQYYRLRQLDLDNREKFTQTIYIDREKQEGLLLEKLYPNPAKDLLQLVIRSQEKTQRVISIKDFTGRTIISKLITVVEGINSIALDIHQLGRGVYLLDIFSSSGESQFTRFVKQ